jgi:protein gp37
MGQNSKIEWTHHTFNPWWGCVKISPACEHCYAETWSKRLGLKLWGDGQDQRRFFSDDHWRQPLRWNAEALAAGERRRVFCASMADVFEKRGELNPWRSRLWPVIAATPALDWLLLTKRIGNVRKMVPKSWLAGAWPANAMLGITVVNPLEWARDVPKLRALPAPVRFISAEPLIADLGAVDLQGIHWLIAGGESGHHARPMQPAWARTLREQCDAAGVQFFMKQMGGARDKRAALADLPEDLRVRDFPRRPPEQPAAAGAA